MNLPLRSRLAAFVFFSVLASAGCATVAPYEGPPLAQMPQAIMTAKPCSPMAFTPTPNVNATTGWTAKLAEFIRPFITLVFMGLFCAKALSLLSFTFGLNFSGQGMMAGLDAFVKATNAVWDDRTHELFVTIIVFWFGDRGMRRATGR